jgi:hypothetical protein
MVGQDKMVVLVQQIHLVVTAAEAEVAVVEVLIQLVLVLVVVRVEQVVLVDQVAVDQLLLFIFHHKEIKWQLILLEMME